MKKEDRRRLKGGERNTPLNATSHPAAAKGGEQADGIGFSCVCRASHELHKTTRLLKEKNRWSRKNKPTKRKSPYSVPRCGKKSSSVGVKGATEGRIQICQMRGGLEVSKIGKEDGEIRKGITPLWEGLIGRAQRSRGKKKKSKQSQRSNRGD